MRIQTACRLTVRFAWDVAADHNHPDYTFSCAEDREMAVTAALRAAEIAPRGIRLLGAAVSADGGRSGPWEPLELEESA